jgi:hypothetical protein
MKFKRLASIINRGSVDGFKFAEFHSWCDGVERMDDPQSRSSKKRRINTGSTDTPLLSRRALINSTIETKGHKYSVSLNNDTSCQRADSHCLLWERGPLSIIWELSAILQLYSKDDGGGGCRSVEDRQTDIHAGKKECLQYRSDKRVVKELTQTVKEREAQKFKIVLSIDSHKRWTRSLASCTHLTRKSLSAQNRGIYLKTKRQKNYYYFILVEISFSFSPALLIIIYINYKF